MFFLYIRSIIEMNTHMTYIYIVCVYTHLFIHVGLVWMVVSVHINIHLQINTHNHMCMHMCVHTYIYTHTSIICVCVKGKKKGE